ncbi:hypothetical protein CLOM_g7931 [Closterium sp. NIES-68]|nr:hypothetical protein CLOM_g7931 [Closterium sp. NIES-68]GJP60305.1 hypothetical protein CLOP_g17512 [Closterium sp. NIES-67]
MAGGAEAASGVVVDVSTPLLPREAARSRECVSSPNGSPSPPHSPAARRIVAAAKIAAIVGCVALLGALCLLVPRRAALETSADDAVSSSSSSAAVRFFAFGDWGRNGTFNQSLIAQQMGTVGQQMAPQFVVSVGDNFYDEGLTDVNDDQFTRSFSNIYTHRSLQVPWYAVLGNHDYYGNALAQLHPALANRDPRWVCRRSMALSLPLCAAPTVDCADLVDLFLYDSTPLVPAYRHKKGRRVDWRGLNTGNWSQQEAAQLQELEGWVGNSRARWKVVVGHHPVFSYGHHGHQQEMVDRVKPLLERYGVDAYLNGHDHNMQHVKRDDSPVHYFTVGGGSKAWRSDAPSEAPGLRFYFPGQGFSALHVDTDTLSVAFYGVDGQQMYSTTLRK